MLYRDDYRWEPFKKFIKITISKLLKFKFKSHFIPLSDSHIAANYLTKILSSKILVLDLEKLSKIIHIFDEMGIKKIDNHQDDRPLWSLVNIDEASFKDLPVKFSISKN